jgi:hypothetical protein
MRRQLTSLSAVILGLVLLLTPASALAQSSGATLSAGSGSGSPGDTGISVSVSISSDSGVDVAGLNFDLAYSSSALEVANVTIGSAASGADKLISWSSPSSGRIRVIVFGLNQDSIPNGTVARVSLNVKSSASPGSTSLDILNQAATDPEGSSVPLSANDGSFTVLAPPATAVPTNTSVPTATNTSPPTATDEPSPTHTPTATPSNTPDPKTGPSSTPRPATATSVPPTHTPYPTSTHQFSSTATATTAYNASTATPTGTLIPQASGTDQTPTTQPLGSATASPEEATATNEALAELDQAVIATSTALASSAPSPTGTALVAADAESAQKPTSDEPAKNPLAGLFNLTSIAIVGLALVGSASTVLLVISLKNVIFFDD